MNLLLTNDDGIDAPGIAALGEACAGLGPCVVVAPAEHQSGCSHMATTNRGIALNRLQEDRFSLDGSPVDCSRIGLYLLAPNTQWVLSGINEGGNLGADVYLSGTVAAAREACLLGKPAIAISQYMKRRVADWKRAARWTRHVLQILFERPPEPGTFWNVNLPDPDAALEAIPPCVFCDIDPHPLPIAYEDRGGKLHYRARYQDRRREPGLDVEQCFAGRITISQIGLRVVPATCAADPKPSAD